MRKEKTLLVKEDIQIGDVILEAGDKIQILDESYSEKRNDFFLWASQFYQTFGPEEGGRELAEAVVGSLEGLNDTGKEMGSEFVGAFLKRISRLG